MTQNIFDRLESEVRSYCRAFPAVFKTAKGSRLIDENGLEYIDFFGGAGTMSYGHNEPRIKQAVLDYLMNDGITHSLDMWTVAKREFMEAFEHWILKPRNLDYKFQFTGPTGTNAVESALKLARKVKNRRNVVAFTNGYHGLSGGALAATGNRHFRTEQFINRLDVSFLPFDGYLGVGVDTLDYFRRLLTDQSSGMDIPAAVILETVQAEGGINVASPEWLQGLEKICREFDILLIVDDIQVGNGRAGRFFSFESAGIRPDIVVLSKAIGGIGQPMSLVLIDPEIDLWKPAEHTGTFRGNNLAFVGARAAVETFWKDDELVHKIEASEEYLRKSLLHISKHYGDLGIKVRGRGLIYGLEFADAPLAKEITREAFQRGLIIELAGSDDQVIKFLPPLVIEMEDLQRGVEIIRDSLDTVLADKKNLSLPQNGVAMV